MTHYPDASFRAVARTGLDTLFAVAWADLDKEPLVLSVPDTDGRYYVIALFDMWSNVFASIGKRTTGTGAANFLIAGPGWQGTPPADVTTGLPVPDAVRVGQRADAGERTAGLRGGERAAEAIQADAAQRLGQPYTPPAEVPVACGRRHEDPAARAGAEDGRRGLLRAARAADEGQPPGPADGPMVEKLKKTRHRAREGLRHRQDRSGHRQGTAARDGRVRIAAERREEAEDRERLDRDAEGYGPRRWPSASTCS